MLAAGAGVGRHHAVGRRHASSEAAMRQSASDISVKQSSSDTSVTSLYTAANDCDEDPIMV